MHKYTQIALSHFIHAQCDYKQTIAFSELAWLMKIEQMADIRVILELQEKVLRENHDFIIKHLDADDVIDELIQARLMGKNAAQRVGLMTMHRVDKNRIICEQLSTAGPGALERFCGIIKKECRQTFIAEQLEKCSGMYKTIQ